MNFDSMMPRDPFANDPNDPASFIEDFGDSEPALELTPEDRLQLQEDLRLVRECQRVLAPRGMRGIMFLCEDCESVHYYDWEIMAANMVATLHNEIAAVHEPSAHPDVEAYVTWDYALGYLDGLEGR